MSKGASVLAWLVCGAALVVTAIVTYSGEQREPHPISTPQIPEEATSLLEGQLYIYQDGELLPVDRPELSEGQGSCEPEVFPLAERMPVEDDAGPEQEFVQYEKKIDTLKVNLAEEERRSAYLLALVEQFLSGQGSTELNGAEVLRVEQRYLLEARKRGIDVRPGDPFHSCLQQLEERIARIESDAAVRASLRARFTFDYCEQIRQVFEQYTAQMQEAADNPADLDLLKRQRASGLQPYLPSEIWN